MDEQERRKLETRLALALEPQCVHPADQHECVNVVCGGRAAGEIGYFWRCKACGEWIDSEDGVPHYTQSTDLALRLWRILAARWDEEAIKASEEKGVMTWGVSVTCITTTGDGGTKVRLIPPLIGEYLHTARYYCKESWSHADTPALALCMALLKTLPEEETNGGD